MVMIAAVGLQIKGLGTLYVKSLVENAHRHRLCSILHLQRN